jgi:hypothetical protein
VSGAHARRSSLSVAPNPARRYETVAWFCGHCGSRPAVAPEVGRVCGDCGLGLLVKADAAVAPAPGDPFLIVDGALAVQAVSSGAESLLCAQEVDAVNRHVTELVLPADAQAAEPATLAYAVALATRGEVAEPVSMFLRPASTFGVRIRARIAPCGPGLSALLVLD